MRERRIAGRRAVRWVLGGAWLVATACGTADVPVLSVGREGGAVGPTNVPSLGTLADFCAGSGPATLVASTADGGALLICPAQLAQRAFPYALCTCGDFVSSQALGASDGAADAGGTSAAGASVGVNGNLSAGALQVSGSVWATAGLSVSGDVTVGGALHVPATAPFFVAGAKDFTRVEEAFSAAPACDCAPSDLVDVTGVAATYQAHNDDAALGVEEAALENVQSDTTVTLGSCGRVYFTHVGANLGTTIHLTVSSRVVVVIGGYVSVANLAIDVSDGGELDLFVGGPLITAGTFTVGDPAHPERSRVYVGGSMNLQGAANVYASVYVPHSVTLGASSPTTIHGALFAATVNASADLTVAYDDAIVSLASTPPCPAP